MNIFFIVLLIALIITIVVVLGLLIAKIEKDYILKTTQTLLDVLDLKAFYPIEVHFVNKHLSLALNKTKTKLALVKNFNPKNPQYFEYSEIAIPFIEKIEKNISAKLFYIKKGEIKFLNIYPLNNEIADFLHRVFKLSLIKRVESKFSQHSFSDFGSSDWQCSYFWAYSKYDNTFAYLKTADKPLMGSINLKKEHFTIDTKYNYFEAPIFGIAQQLFNYDKEFLSNVYKSLLKTISQKFGSIVENSIYYDNYSNIIYLTNGSTSLQSIIIDKIEDVEYRDNRLTFTLLDSQKRINYIATQQQISDFEDFMINYNLKKIAHNFDNRVDKLVNTTPYTKLIIDFSRDRLIYCANLNKFSKFSYLTIPFVDLYDISVEKSGMKHFIRIHTKDKEIIDVTCDKKEVAQYIQAQVVKNVL